MNDPTEATTMEFERVCTGGSDGSPSCGHPRNKFNAKKGVCVERVGKHYRPCLHRCTFPDSERVAQFIGCPEAEKDQTFLATATCPACERKGNVWVSTDAILHKTMLCVTCSNAKVETALALSCKNCHSLLAPDGLKHFDGSYYCASNRTHAEPDRVERHEDYAHSKDCAAFTATTDGFIKECDCRCICNHSRSQHIQYGEGSSHEDCAIDDCPCLKFQPCNSPVHAPAEPQSESTGYQQVSTTELGENRVVVTFEKPAEPARCKWCGYAGMLTADGICTHHDPANWTADPATPPVPVESQPWPPTRVFLPTGVVQLAAVSPELQNGEGAWWIREDAPATPSVEAAGREIRELYPGCSFQIREEHNAGFNKYAVPHFEIGIISTDYMFNERFEGATFTEAMQQVRQWVKENQK